MSTPTLVEAFYRRLWNNGDLSAASELISEGFSFRGSLGVSMQGRAAFLDYVRSVREALGIHAGRLRGYQPTGKPVHWFGAALFFWQEELISDLWVLGDLAGLDAVLEANATA